MENIINKVKELQDEEEFFMIFDFLTENNTIKNFYSI